MGRGSGRGRSHRHLSLLYLPTYPALPPSRQNAQRRCIQARVNRWLISKWIASEGGALAHQCHSHQTRLMAKSGTIALLFEAMKLADGNLL
jgi:hypothetical protein